MVPVAPTVPVVRDATIRHEETDLMKIQAVCVTDVISRKRLRFGQIGALGKLEKHAAASGFALTKSISELAVPGLRRSLGVRGR